MPIQPNDPLPQTVSPTLRVTCARFADSLTGTNDSVYQHLLRISHGRQTKTVEEWRVLLETYRTQPVERPKSSKVVKIR